MVLYKKQNTNSKDKIPTFAAFARSVLFRVLKFTKHRDDLCFDVHESPSIKNIKRESRGNKNNKKRIPIT